MDFYRVIQSRRSIRKYKSIPVEEEKLNRILEAACLAPTAANRQPWHFIVIKDKQTRQQLKEAYPKEWFYTAPLIICACTEPAKSWVRRDKKNYAEVDVSIVFDHLILAATAEGLGTCWIGAFDPLAVRKILELPEEIEPVVLTPLGYPDESPAARERKPLQELIHWNKWA